MRRHTIGILYIISGIGFLTSWILGSRDLVIGNYIIKSEEMRFIGYVGLGLALITQRIDNWIRRGKK